jgi:DNA-binding response OmpR family regulator
VLVVDDEPLIAETLAAILNASGVAALTAPDGKAALEIIEVMPPDMLITDIAMPGVNGLDLAIEVARMVADCEIILFSGQAATAEMLAALRSAGRDFVTMTKPVHPSDLLARVFERLGGRVDPSAALHARSKFD